MADIQIISWLGAIQGTLISTYFFVKSRRRLANLMLGLFVFFFSLGLLETWVTGQAPGVVQRVLSLLVRNGAFLYGPLLYLFFYFLTTGTNVFQPGMLRHFGLFIFFVLAELIALVSNIALTAEQDDWIALIGLEILFVQLFIYNLKSIQLLRRYHSKLPTLYSSFEEIDVIRLKAFVYFITGIYLFSFVLSNFLLFGLHAAEKPLRFVNLLITFSVYGLSYFVLLRPHLFQLTARFTKVDADTTEHQAEPSPLYVVREKSEEGEVVAHPAEKYKNSGLKPEQAQRYKDELMAVMEDKKLFLQPGLSIFDLAVQTGISKNHLTQVLNMELGVNFFELINRCRIEHAKVLMTDGGFTHLTLEGIGEKSGFQSKASFYANFKKQAGLTPQAWLKSQSAT